MLRLLITVLIFNISGVQARAPGTFNLARNELLKTSQKELLFWLNTIVSDSLPSRMVGKPGHAKIQNYLKESIKKIDSKNKGKLVVTTFSPDVEEAKKFYQNDFDQKVEGKIQTGSNEYNKWKRFTAYIKDEADKLKNHQGENIVWEKNGLDASKVLVITAHYDTISVDPNSLTINDKDPMPGANFNASGMAVALGIIKTLADIDLNYSVQVAFLDWQGIGYLGSKQYAQDLKNSGKKIMGVMNLEMLGQDTSFFDKSKKTGNMCVYLRANPEEEKWVKKLTEYGNRINDKVTFEIKPNNFDQSDTFRFWEKDLLAATFSQNWEDDFNPKFYQTKEDTPEKLNHDTLYKSYQYIGGAVLGTLLDLTR
jgi:Zn-dependent M28 family amino/carboxypeptidase